MVASDLIRDISGGNLVVAAFLIGSICMILTTLGSIISLLGRRLSTRFLDAGLGFSAGVMIVASFTSLLLPAIEMGGIARGLIGFITGAGVISFIESRLPHEHLVKGYEGPDHLRGRLKAIWMMVIAIIIHNFPEGLAVGASTAYSIDEGLLTAIAIGLQDIPEGIAVSLPLILIGRRIRQAVFIGFLSGASEPLMAIIPVLLIGLSGEILPYALAFASGSMIFVVSHEVIPDTHSHGNENLATLGLIIGFLVMLYLDTMFG